TTSNITITIADDALQESSEIVIVTMGAPTNASQGATIEHTATITDNEEPPTVSWTLLSQFDDESAGTMTVTAQISETSIFDVTVPFTVTGMATGGSTDYSITASPIIIPAGSISSNITITIVNDTLDESNETVVITMGEPTNATLGLTPEQTAIIVDNDDSPTVVFTASSQSAAESVSTMTVTAELSTASGHDVIVPFSLTGTATGGGTDYSITASPITITAGNLTSNITITIVDDALQEASETVIVTMGAPTNATQGVTTVHTATINDNDEPPTVTFTSASQSASESAGTMTVTAQLSFVSALDVTVPFTLTGTATGSGTDYSITASPITITAGNTTADITITITNDILDENNETIIVTMGSPTNATQGLTTVHTATIADDDASPTVTVTSTLQSKAEDAGTASITVQLNTPSGLDVSVPFTLTGTATGSGTDYSITASPITITAGQTTTTITYTITNDALDENDETAIVTLGAPTNATLGTDTIHTLTIQDNDDPPTVTFTSASQSSVNESGSLTVTAELSAVSGLDVIVPFTLTGTATGGSTDYSIIASPITITAGQTTGNITIALSSDTLDETNETVIVNMGDPTNAVQGATIVHTATITDDDLPPIVTVTSVSQSKAESAGTATVTIQLSTPSGLTVTVPYTLTGTALGGSSDYSVTASPVSIAPGDTTAIVTFAITDDALDENDETAILTLDAPTNGTLGTDSVHTLTITDNDVAPTVTVTSTSQSKAEDAGTASVTIQLNTASGLDVTIPFTLSGTAASGSVDYSTTASPITITAGQTTTTITYTITNDALDENDETAIVTLGAPTNGTLGTDIEHTLTIVDTGTAPSVAWTTATQSGVESVGTMTVTAQLSAVSGLDVTIPYTLTGTATGSGTDYSITVSPIIISAGQTTATVTVAVTNDPLDENDETAIITMGAPTNATNGVIIVQTITIADDDNSPTVAWTTSSQSAGEESGTITIIAELSAVSGLDVTVPYTLTGTATGSGTDYSVTASPITITAGNTTTNITITITSDTLDENNETIIVTMGSPTNATQGATTVHTATITDDDASPTVAWTESTQSQIENDATITLTAQLSAVSALTVTVPYTVAGTATGSGVDYSITASPATISAGQTTTSITITIIEERIVEPDETIIVTMGSPTNASQGVTTVHTATIVRDDVSQTYPNLPSTVGGSTTNSVSISSPTEGEEIIHDSRKAINWSSSGSFSFVNLYYSFGQGTAYQVIERNLVNTGSYTWTIPNEVGSTITLKLEATDLANVLASDTASFTIIDGVIVEEETTTETEGIEGTEETPTDEEVQEEINIIGMALEEVFGERWLEDAEKRGLSEVFPNFPASVAIGTLIKLPDDGDLNTQYDSAVYYIGGDHRRHPFPNEAVYKSWFSNFYGIRTVEAETMASIPLGPLVTFRPGSTLVKFPSIPKVYSIDATGALRWLASESLAANLYGNDWSKTVQDVSEAFWSSYRFGDDLIATNDQNWDTIMAKR
ncbi:MAG: Calx-beta domain-containing protein, partial [Candidatus Uhrbacteria bacterium]